MTTDTNHIFYKINMIGFISILFLWGISILFIPKKTFSEIEKRPLKAFPAFSTHEVFYNKYTDSLDTYIADNFALRDYFVNLSFSLKALRGWKSDEFGTYDVALDLDAGVGEMEENLDSLMKNGGEAKDVENLGKVLFYKGRAIQRFGGVNKTKYGLSSEYNAKVINAYQDSLGKNVRVFSVIAPSAGEILLPSEFLSKQRSECSDIKEIEGMLYPHIKKADVCIELHRRKDQYLYFSTDHHWTGRGAYCGYVAFCKAAGFTPLALESMEHHVISGGFLGSLYRLTKDPRLAANPDSVEYFKVPNKHKAFEVAGQRYDKKNKKMLYVEFAKGENSYGVFLGDDYPLMCVETNVKNGRTAMIIKNSYGNPFSTFLAAHYERIFIADYRKFKGNIVDFCRKNGVNDFIVFQNSFSANTVSHTEKIQKMLTAPMKVNAIAVDTLPF